MLARKSKTLGTQARQSETDRTILAVLTDCLDGK